MKACLRGSPMRKVFLLLLLFAWLLNSPIKAEIVDVEAVVNDPNSAIVHVYSEFFPFIGIDETITINLPTITLAPGDVLRIRVHFNGHTLKIINGAERLDFLASLEAGPATGVGYGLTNNGSSQLRLRSSEHIFDVVETGTFGFTSWNNTDNEINAYFNDYQIFTGDISDGSLLGSFWLEMTIPTMVDGSPYAGDTFINNTLVIGLSHSDPPGDVPLWEVLAPTPDHCIEPPLADTNNDCKLDLIDFATFVSEWLNCGFFDPLECG